MYLKKAIGALCAAAALMAGCSGNEPVPLYDGSGAVDVSVAALGAADAAAIQKVVILLETQFGESLLMYDRFELKYNGSEWTTRIEGLTAGDYRITAQAWASEDHWDGELGYDTIPPTFVSDGIPVTVSAGGVAAARIIMNQQNLKEGIAAPEVLWITSSQTSLRPEQSTTITVGFRDPGGDGVSLEGISMAGTWSDPTTADENTTAGSSFGSLSVEWEAPEAPGFYELELALSNGKAVLHLQFFIRVMGAAGDIAATFKLNLAPVMVSLEVDAANPWKSVLVPDEVLDPNDLSLRELVDWAVRECPLFHAVPEWSFVEVSFAAEDPDNCAEGDYDECQASTYQWTIPEDCGYGFQWLRFQIPILGEFACPIVDDASGTFGAERFEAPHLLAFPFDGAYADGCELKLTLVDGDGATTESSVHIKPYQTVTQYTPTIEFSFQSSDRAADGATLYFEARSWYHFYDGFNFLDPPQTSWTIGREEDPEEVASDAWEAKDVIGLLDPEGDIHDLVGYRTGYEWAVGDPVHGCLSVGTETKIYVHARVCNDFVYAEYPTGDLCNYETFEVLVPDDLVDDVCL